MREPEIALVFSPEVWVEELHRHFVDHGGVRVRQVLVDPSLALEEEYDALVVSHRWPALTRPLVAELHDRRRRILGVYEREEPAGRELLERLGVDRVVESDAGPREFLEALLLLMRDSASPFAPEEAGAAVKMSPGRQRGGRAVLVGGPAGAGKTEVAIEMSRAAAARGSAVVLVDADEVAPAVAARLGMPIEPNLRSAVDAVEFGLGALPDAVRDHAHGRFSLVGGLPNVAAWSQVRPGEVVRVVRGLAQAHGGVVVDTSAPLDDVGPGSRGRYALARALLVEADAVVAVGVASPVGVTRLLAWLAAAHSLAPTAPVHVLVNRAPGDRFRRGEIFDEVNRTFPPASISFAPADRRVEAAAWSGALVSRGPFTRAVAGVVPAVFPAPAPRRRIRRRAPRSVQERETKERSS